MRLILYLLLLAVFLTVIYFLFYAVLFVEKSRPSSFPDANTKVHTIDGDKSVPFQYRQAVDVENKLTENLFRGHIINLDGNKNLVTLQLDKTKQLAEFAVTDTTSVICWQQTVTTSGGEKVDMSKMYIALPPNQELALANQREESLSFLFSNLNLLNRYALVHTSNTSPEQFVDQIAIVGC